MNQNNSNSPQNIPKPPINLQENIPQYQQPQYQQEQMPQQQEGSSIGPPRPNQQQQTIIQQQKYQGYIQNPYPQHPNYDNYPPYPPQQQQQYQQQQYPPQQNYGPPPTQQQQQQYHRGPPPQQQGGLLNEFYNGIQDIMHYQDEPHQGGYNQHQQQYPPHGYDNQHRGRRSRSWDRDRRSRDRRSRSRDNKKQYPSNISDGDWNCTNCDNWNFARRQECNKCSSMRRTNQGEVYFGGNGSQQRSYGRDDRDHGRRDDYRRGGPDNRRGDRRGGSDRGGRRDSRDRRDNNNSRRDDRRRDNHRDSNHRQGGKGPQMSDGDWICSKCKNINFKSRIQCNRCKEDKKDVCERVHRGGDQRNDSHQRDRPRKGSNDGGRGKSSQQKDGDWECGQCQNINFKWRDQCNRCKTPRNPSQM